MQLSEPRSRYELPPAGTHLARLYKFTDLGWQTSTCEDEAPDQHQAILGWELCGAYVGWPALRRVENDQFVPAREIDFSRLG
jgi:hypothetical protein